MRSRIVILIFLLPFSLLPFSYIKGKFYKGRQIRDEFRFIGKVPKTVNGKLVLRAWCSFKTVSLTYHPSYENKHLDPHDKKHHLIPARNGKINFTIHILQGKGAYHFSMWGRPGLNGKRYTFIGHINVINTAPARPGVSGGRVAFSVDPVTFRKRVTDNGMVRIAGKTDAAFLMIIARKGNLAAKSTLPVRDGCFDIPLRLRFGAGKYLLILLTADSKGLNFRSRKLLNIRNTFTRDVRFTAPSPDIQSDDPRIQKLARQLAGRMTGPLQKTRALYTWVTRNIRYDWVSLYKGIVHHRSALDVIREKKAVCYGYSLLFTALLRAQGLQARIISGMGKSKAFRDRWMGHAWVQVKIGNRWISTDPTWDASTVARRGGRRQYRKWRWFDPPAAFFNNRHRKKGILLK